MRTHSPRGALICLFALTSVSAFTACNFLSGQKKCSSNRDCPSDAYCDASKGGYCYVGSADGGSDGGNNQGICTPVCSAWQECPASTNACQARYAGITVTKPVAGATVGRVVPITVNLDTKLGSDRNDPISLDVYVTAGPAGVGTKVATLTLDATPGVYQGTWNPSQIGSYTVEVRYTDAGFKSSFTVTVDFTPPVLKFSYQPPSRPQSTGLTNMDPFPGYKDAYRKDEKVVLTVTSAATNVDPSSVVVMMKDAQGASHGPIAVSLSSTDGSPYTGNATIDLATIPLTAFRGIETIEVDGSNVLGNPSVTSPQTLNVTRFKWSFQGDNLAISSSPALGNSGAVYFGTSNGGSAGTFYALFPNGKVQWAKDYGSVRGSPAVGTMNSPGKENVYVGITGSIVSSPAAPEALRVLSGLDGSDVITPVASCNSGCGYLGAIAIANEAGVETVITLRNASITTNSELLSIQASTGAFATSFAGAGAVSPGSMVTDGSHTFFGDDKSRIHSYTISGGNLTPSGGQWPVQENLYVRLALANNVLYGVGDQGGNGQAFSLDSVNGTSIGIYPPTPSSAAFFSLVMPTNASMVFGTDAPDLLGLVVSGTTFSTTTSNLPQMVQASPVLGNGGTIYTVSTAGSVDARLISNFTSVWSLPDTDVAAPSGSDIRTSPTIDCARDDAGKTIAGRPGILYVPSTGGVLYAYVVDSSGIDKSAAWPKFQHDPRNTGNSTTDLSPFSCP